MGLAGRGILPLMGMVFDSRFCVAFFGRVTGFVMVSSVFSAVGPLIVGCAYVLACRYDSTSRIFRAILLPAGIAMRWLPDAAVMTPH